MSSSRSSSFCSPCPCWPRSTPSGDSEQEGERSTDDRKRPSFPRRRSAAQGKCLHDIRSGANVRGTRARFFGWAGLITRRCLLDQLTPSLDQLTPVDSFRLCTRITKREHDLMNSEEQAGPPKPGPRPLLPPGED